MTKRIFAALALLGFVTLTGCNTVSGMGKDIKAGGSEVKEEAREVKQKM